MGTPVKLKLSNMHAKNEVIDSTKVQGLMVRGFNSPQKIRLPSTYTRDIMPANRAHIPTPEVAESWSHLEHIANFILPLQGCEVGLLIGYNCTKALTPRDIIAPTGNGPYGQRTDLGWGIVGVAETAWEDMDSDNVGISHHIVVKDTARDLTLARNVGPDFINSLCGVLCRFRKEPIAFVCDIEKMFLQFKVDVQHRNYLRFLWWENGDMDSEPLTYRMTRHLFGTTSSPGGANFSLRKIATEGDSDFAMDGGNSNDRHLRCTSPLYRLHPFLDEHYLLRVVSRLNKGSFRKDLKHPVILPRKSHVTELIISHFHQKLQHHLSNQGCDYITFKHNTLSVSHIGGVGERQIRMVRNVLSSLTHEFGASLDKESQRTFLCETMAIVNCRPLTVDGLNDPLTAEPLTPNHPLTMKSKIILPKPGKFQSHIYTVGRGGDEYSIQ